MQVNAMHGQMKAEAVGKRERSCHACLLQLSNARCVLGRTRRLESGHTPGPCFEVDPHRHACGSAFHMMTRVIGDADGGAECRGGWTTVALSRVSEMG
nr:hypothetical protein CFP56_33630 [Quercus suber]